MGSSEDRNTPVPSVITGPTAQSATITPSMRNGYGAGPSNASTMSGLSSPTSTSGLPTPGFNGNTMSSSKAAQLIDAHPHVTGGPSYGVPPPPPKPYDPTEDDPLDNTTHSMRSGNSSGDPHASAYVVAPSIQVRSEFPTVTPTNANGSGLGAASQSQTHPLTCIVVVELPSRRTGPPPQNMSVTVDPAMFSPAPVAQSLRNEDFNGVGGTMTQRHGTTKRRPNEHHQQQHQSLSAPQSHPNSNHNSPPQNNSPIPAPAPAPAPAPVEDTTLTDAPNSAFESIALDLRNRIADWKGHPMEGLGSLQKFDILSVKRDTLVREFLVYLFKEAIICVLEDKKKTTTSTTTGGESTTRPALRLKGRIYIRHIKRVMDTSSGPELSLTIEMEDERLDSFILIFKDRMTLEGWRGVVARLVQEVRDRERGVTTAASAPAPTTTEQQQGPTHTVTGRPRAGTNTSGPPPGMRLPPPPQQQQQLGDMDEFGVQTRAQNPQVAHIQATAKGPRVMSGASTAATTSRTTNSSVVDEEHGTMNHSAGGGGVRNPHRGTMSSTATSAAASNSSYYAKVPPPPGTADYHAHQQAQQQYSGHPHMISPSPAIVVPHTSNAAPSNSLPPIGHTPMDLILVISLPAPTSHPSTAQLKLRVIKQTMDFVLGSLGMRDRLSIVTFEVGVGGRVRKTPFLRLGRAMGRERLERFVDTMSFGGYDDNGDTDSVNGTVTGISASGDHDEFLIRTGKDEKTDVVTGVNHGTVDPGRMFH